MFIENPYYRLLTNSTIYTPLASSPVISIIVAIDSDGTVSQQDDVVTNSLVIARLDDEDSIGVFEQDPTNYQLYHYMFPPLRRQNMGQYTIYLGINTCIYSNCTTYSCIASFSEVNGEQLLNVLIEVVITTEGDAVFCMVIF